MNRNEELKEINLKLQSLINILIDKELITKEEVEHSLNHHSKLESGISLKNYPSFSTILLETLDDIDRDTIMEAIESKADNIERNDID